MIVGRSQDDSDPSHPREVLGNLPGIAVQMLTSGTTGAPKRVDLSLRAIEHSLLGAKHYEESLGEMKPAELLIDRIIFLEGVPEISRYDVIHVGTSVKEQLENDLTLEVNGVNAYNDAVALCIEENDGHNIFFNFGNSHSV